MESATCCGMELARSVVWNHHEVMYGINPKADTRWRVMRYKGGSPPLMIYTALRAAMIYQACGLDNKKTSVYR